MKDRNEGRSRAPRAVLRRGLHLGPRARAMFASDAGSLRAGLGSGLFPPGSGSRLRGVEDVVGEAGGQFRELLADGVEALPVFGESPTPCRAARRGPAG